MQVTQTLPIVYMAKNVFDIRLICFNVDDPHGPGMFETPSHTGRARQCSRVL